MSFFERQQKKRIRRTLRHFSQVKAIINGHLNFTLAVKCTHTKQGVYVWHMKPEMWARNEPPNETWAKKTLYTSATVNERERTTFFKNVSMVSWFLILSLNTQWLTCKVSKRISLELKVPSRSRRIIITRAKKSVRALCVSSFKANSQASLGKEWDPTGPPKAEFRTGYKLHEPSQLRLGYSIWTTFLLNADSFLI